MKCILCGKKSVIELQQGPLCRDCFIRNFQKKVYRNIRKFRLFTKTDVLCFAVSGGGDSMSVLYIVKDIAKKQRQGFFVLNIDEGGKDCKRRTAHAQNFCSKHGIDFLSLTFKGETGKTCRELRKDAKKGLDTDFSEFCDALRMKILARHAKKQGATRVVLGTNLDDEANAFLMNLIRKGENITSGLGPSVKFGGMKFIKPLFMCGREETDLYSKYMKLGITCDCACSMKSKGKFIDRKLDELDRSFRGTKTAIIQNVLDLIKDKRR